MARPARTRKGKFTKVKGYGNSNGRIGEFSRQADGVGKVLKTSPNSIGGMKDSKGNPTGHNYTTLKDGTKVRNTSGTLNKRQRYYDRRTGLGLVGG